MNADSLELGATYFRITYVDVAQTMPGVEPLVYVGVNIFGPPPNGEGNKYYFQDAISVIGSGSVANGSSGDDISGFNSEDDVGCFYSTHEAREIGVVVIDLPALVVEIGSTLERAKDLGFPRLVKAKGKWI
jgi:hypothetical protein